MSADAPNPLSIATWSLHPLFEGGLALEDMPAFVRNQYDVRALEPITGQFAKQSPAYAKTIRQSADDAGVTLLNLAIDVWDGDVSSEDDAVRQAGLDGNKKWLDLAAELGVAAARCNTGGREAKDVAAATQHCTESFVELTRYANERGITMLVENHWGLSADPAMIEELVLAVRRELGEDAIATCVDWGNWPADVDRYAAIERLLPYAKAVHAKVEPVQDDGSEFGHHPDFNLQRCLDLTTASGFTGHLGIEAEKTGDQCEHLVGRAVNLVRHLQGKPEVPA